MRWRSNNSRDKATARESSVENARRRSSTAPLTLDPIDGAEVVIGVQEGLDYMQPGEPASFGDRDPHLGPRMVDVILPVLDERAALPGVLASINAIFAEHRVNIEGQTLGTRGDVGYVITDIASDYTDDMLGRLAHMDETIRLSTSNPSQRGARRWTHCRIASWDRSIMGSRILDAFLKLFEHR